MRILAIDPGCRKGHALDAANVMSVHGTYRRCLTCHNANTLAAGRRMRANPAYRARRATELRAWRAGRKVAGL